MVRGRLRRSTPLAWGVVAVSSVILLVSVLVLVNATRDASQGRVVGRTAEVTLGQEETLRIAYVGDSLAGGLYATTEEDTYRYLTTIALAGDGPYEEEGRSLVGGTVEQTLERNEQLPTDQHIYIIELGTNDINEVDLSGFRRQYEALLDRVQTASPDASLVCLGTWRPPSTGAKYDLIIRQQCEANGGVYRRLSDLEGDEANKGPEDEQTYQGPSDTFHPNDTGHAAIVERILDAVEVRRDG